MATSPLLVSLAVGASVLGVVLSFMLRSTSDGRIVNLGGIPILNAWKFFSKRYDFMSAGFRKAGGLPFSFRILQYRVVAVSGTEARKHFFNDPTLGFVEGYRILIGGPKMEDIDIKTDVLEDISGVHKRLNLLLKRERISETLPTFLEDINRRMLGWGQGSNGSINPFKEVYDLVLQMTVRMATCQEIAKDVDVIKKIDKMYWDIELSSTPTRLLLPWIPSPSKKLGEKAMMGLYLLFLKYVQDGRAAGAETNDPIDVLIRNGDSDNDIVEVIIGAVFTGFVNTGVNTCWALLYLGTHPQWRERARKELDGLISRHTSTSPAGEPFHRLLSSIPFDAWESELPIVDLIIRETIRLSFNVTVPRRNLGKDIVIQDTVVKKGDFLVYSLGDANLNPEIYRNPEEFDPGRFEEGREEDKKVHFGYLGWGAGRHPCAGMRIARLEIKLVLAMLLLGYDYTLVDGKGRPTNVLPKPNRNDIQQARPMGETVYMKFKRVRD
ncbi:cytochrome P450 [Crepidotus variabilis]|uniref:Cytochrome P450 n=1 Tax=Crepidotus variabilis TaxID=179855 RepID=A0A9P6E4F7_9AGAR|nr:cytochrome P450 [Crepidotus variabilis]